MLQVLGERTKDRLNDWRNGRRKPPAWVWPLLARELARRREALDHALALVRTEQERANK